MSFFKPRQPPAPVIDLCSDDVVFMAKVVALHLEDPAAVGLTQRGVPRPDIARRAFDRAVALAGLSATSDVYYIRWEG